MHAICPITDKRINETVARFNGFVTASFVVIFLVSDFWIGIAFMLLDFIIRGFIDNKYSLVCYMNKFLVQKLNLPGKMVNSGPKIFAAQFGVFFTALILLSYFTGYVFIGYVFAGILGLLSFVEAAFGFCVACQLYPFFRRTDR